MTRRFERTLAALMGLVVLLTACGGTGGGGVVATRTLDAPSYSSLAELAQASTLIVRGTIGERQGSFVINEVTDDDPVYAYDVVDFVVEEVIAKASSEASFALGQPIQVGSFNVHHDVADELPSLVAEVAAFSTGLNRGEAAVLYLAPFTFSDSVEGWVTVGSDYGVFERVGTDYVAQAPDGELAEQSYSLTTIRKSVESNSIGTERQDNTMPDPMPPIPSDGVPTTSTPPNQR